MPTICFVVNYVNSDANENELSVIKLALLCTKSISYFVRIKLGRGVFIAYKYYL